MLSEMRNPFSSAEVLEPLTLVRSRLLQSSLAVELASSVLHKNFEKLEFKRRTLVFLAAISSGSHDRRYTHDKSRAINGQRRWLFTMLFSLIKAIAVQSVAK